MEQKERELAEIEGHSEQLMEQILSLKGQINRLHMCLQEGMSVAHLSLEQLSYTNNYSETIRKLEHILRVIT